MLAVAAVPLLWSLFAAAGADARTLYVDRASKGGKCRDARPVRKADSPRTPWCSLGRAVARAPSGSVVLVRGARYPELQVIDDNDRRRAVTFRRYRGERVRLAGLRVERSSRLRFKGFRITSWIKLYDGARRIALIRNNISPRGVRLKAVKGILIRHNRIHDLLPMTSDGMCGCGIWGQATNDRRVRNVRVVGNRITRIAGDGIHFGDGYRILIERNVITKALHIGDGDHVDSIQIMGSLGVVIRGNRIQKNQHGLMFTDDASPRVVIANNVIAQIRSWGLNTGDIPYARIVNNTFWGNGYGANLIRDDSRDPTKLVNIVFKNNIVDRQGIEREDGDRAYFAVNDYNLIAVGDLFGRHDRRGAPRLRGPWRGDFRLARGSKAIDAGTSVGTPWRDRADKRRRDFKGVRNRGGGPVKYFDIGAHER